MFYEIICLFQNKTIIKFQKCSVDIINELRNLGMRRRAQANKTNTFGTSFNGIVLKPVVLNLYHVSLFLLVGSLPFYQYSLRIARKWSYTRFRLILRGGKFFLSFFLIFLIFFSKKLRVLSHHKYLNMSGGAK